MDERSYLCKAYSQQHPLTLAGLKPAFNNVSPRQPMHPLIIIFLFLFNIVTVWLCITAVSPPLQER